MSMIRHAKQRIVPYLMYALLCGVLAIVAYTRIRLLNVPLERDEGEYAYMGQLLLEGIPPYLNAYTMKLPGVSAVYALFMYLFGQTAFGVHVCLLVVNGLCVYFVYLLARKLFERETALISCSLYAMLSVSQTVLGVFAHATHFVLLFVLPGLLLLLHYLENKRIPYIFSSGLCLGLAFTMKQHAIIPLAFASCYLVWRCVRTRPLNKRELYTGCIIYSIGTGLPFLFVLTSMKVAGVFEEFWFWTVQYARVYSEGIPIDQGMVIFRFTIAKVVQPFLPVWLSAAAGCIFACVKRRTAPDRVFLGGFFLFSFLSICPGFYFREHYFVLVLPIISMLAGHGIISAAKLVSESFSTSNARPLLVALIFVPMLGYWISHEKSYLFDQSLYEVSRSTYGANPFPEALVISEYLKAHSTREDKIAILGSEPEILFYANRLSATGHIYMYGLMEEQPFAEQMQNQAITQITQAEPKYVVLVNIPTSWLQQPYSKTTIFDWSNYYLNQYYQVVGIVDMVTPDIIKYIWDEHVVDYTTISDVNIKVYLRKQTASGTIMQHPS